MKEKLPEMFGELAFTKSEMEKYLPKDVYENLINAIKNGESLDANIADAVADGMKKWAIEHGATHYTHWFQPLTEATAEKHNAFISRPQDGKVIMSFSGGELIKGEVDASSFPNGGVRATFEARGYTEWDISSPAFIRYDEKGASLCIPTAFVAYSGQALDGKTPLLRSMEAINEQSVRLLKLFGNTTVKRVKAVVGIEQEYFLIDRDKYLQREDLIQTGRTLFGAAPPKCQQLDDHYYGSIRSTIGAFMNEVNNELWRMGVPAATHHNEVAPAQHELACIYEDANISVDHNQVVMETLKKVASRYNLVCLLAEKPFEYVNGSGKHNNWSLETDEGENLLKPGKTPHENKQFLLILACILKAVDKYATELRFSVANVGNDQRLGRTEAPPAIISVFLGEQLEDIIEQIIETGSAVSSKEKVYIDFGSKMLPNLQKDVTDRNRTSPFAFTGNKFEFRMVGSSASCALPVTVINTIVASAFSDACDVLEKSNNFAEDVNTYIRNTFKEHMRILFSGNGYSKEWEIEAEKRGLKNCPTMVDAIQYIDSQESKELFSKFNVFSEEELELRKEIEYEKYINSKNIEAETMIHMVRKNYLPIIISYSKELAESINVLKNIQADYTVEDTMLKSVIKGKNDICECLMNLEKHMADVKTINELSKKAIYFKDNIVPSMEKLRKEVDEIEYYIYKEFWPVPSYGELLFEVSAI